MEPIYSVKKSLENAKQRLRNSGLSDNVKDKIFEFVDVLREGSGIKEHRHYFCYERVLILSDVLGKDSKSIQTGCT